MMLEVLSLQLYRWFVVEGAGESWQGYSQQKKVLEQPCASSCLSRLSGSECPCFAALLGLGWIVRDRWRT